jgi:uncharacterized protein YuzE
MVLPTLTYDRQVNAIYIRFSTREIDRTLELSLSVYIDVDANGDLVGFEILNVEPGLAGMLPEIPDSTALRDLMAKSAA